jgi:hypothetical protein
MKKLLNNPWFVGVLALVAVAFVAHSLIPANGGSGSAIVEQTGGEEMTDGDTGHPAGGVVDVRRALDELSGGAPTRDPFSMRAKTAPAAVVQVEKAPPPDLVETVRLTALWTQNGETFALINDRICRVGDKLGRLTLETATHDGVWVAHWKGRDFLAIGGSFTLTTPALKAAALTLSTDS